ncbi:hypothetical protein JTE90_003559 [Oedothorax gibbosus]|uniref:XK-related protein n=1 Tax=Oedothorax gibbosus TaxID=931172 RepID=A0AAV6VIE3_9ARAC|nr:hypothetical protein JTE90_003559 [Oedothorax gibbosus]
MVLNVELGAAWKKMKVSRVVVVCGLLTFLFIVEFCIGIRNLYYMFRLWRESSRIPSSNPSVSLTLCVVSVIACFVSSSIVNLISAMWEQKQRTENGKEKSLSRIALHIFVSGMIWRYVSLWFIDDKKLQKKEALLLTLVKFFFTQFFTIPMVIVHASSSEKLEEVIYDVCSASCISINLILTCTVFTWCKAEVNDLKKWNFETIDLIPLIFCQSTDDQPPQRPSDQNKTDIKGTAVGVSDSTVPCDFADDNLESIFLRIIVLFQTFSFTLGRLLALGILLKLAGVYALTILFLQLLISVVYLKFQVPFLVSDSLSKWRQLTRLAFLSYILIFEWHLNRDPKTGYDFTSNIKHSMLYYFIATLESAFYFITWAITEHFTSYNSLTDSSLKQKFLRNIIVIGIVLLMFSLVVHILLLFWHSRRLKAFINSAQRGYLNFKVKISNSEKSKDKPKSKKLQTNKVQPEVDDYTAAFDSSNGCSTKNESPYSIEKRNSYKDLREPIDDEIEIYTRNNKNFICNTILDDKNNAKLHCKSEIQTNCTKQYQKDITNKRENITGIKLETDKEVVSKDGISVSESSPTSKTKLGNFSESINGQLNKLTSASKKFTGTMRDHIHKRKKQFDNYRNPSTEKTSDSSVKKPAEQGVIGKLSKKDSSKVASDTKEVSSEDSSEAYFIGDPRGYDDEPIEVIGSNPETFNIDDIDNSQEDISRNSSIGYANDQMSHQESFEENISQTSSMEDTTNEPRYHENCHLDGEEPCPCHICRPGGSFLRRRSSSIPYIERKQRFLSSMAPEEGSKGSSMLRHPSSPSISVDMMSSRNSDKDEPSDTPCMYLKGRSQNLSLSRWDNKVEHLV